MSVEPNPDGDPEALKYLAGKVGVRALSAVALLMVLSSLTEGVGLLMLVPITQIVAEQSATGIAGEWSEHLAQVPLALLLAGFVALIALRAVLTYATVVRRAALAVGLVRNLRIGAQEAIIGANWRWLSGQRSADHAALIINQADQVGREADRALDLASSVITLVGLIGAALWLAWPLTLATLALGAVTAIVWFALRRREDVLGAPFNDAYIALQGHVTDGLTHLRAARIAGAEAALARDFADTARAIETIEQQYVALGHRAHHVLQVLAAAMLALLVWFGLRVLHLPLALFVPVLAIFARIVPLVGNMQQGWRAWRFCRPALDHLRATVANAKVAAEPKVTAGPPLPFTHSIVFNHVRYGFAGRPQPVLDEFSCVISAGSVVGISGPSGSGKSTLADLLCGLVAPDTGTILIDGAALDDERRIRWRQQVAYVEQVPYLFEGTIAANLAWGVSAPHLSTMEQALRDASAEFVFQLPDGLDTPVGEVGRQLSGGERQRISLARALVRKPSLVILDEVTAALDSANEAAIARTIERLRGTCTFVILGHRPALHALADHVIDLSRDR